MRSQGIEIKDVKIWFKEQFSSYFRKFFRRFRRKVIVMGKMVSITYEIEGNEFVHRFKTNTPMITTGNDDQVCFPAMITPAGIVDLGEYTEDEHTEINPPIVRNRKRRNKPVYSKKKPIKRTKKTTSKKITKKASQKKRKVNRKARSYRVTTSPAGRKTLFTSKHRIAALGTAQRLANRTKKAHLVRSSIGEKVKITPKRITRKRKVNKCKTTSSK